MKQLSGQYSEIEFVRNDSGEIVGQAHRLPKKCARGAPALQRQDSKHGVKLNSAEWDETVQRLVAIFGKGTRQLTNGRDPACAGGASLWRARLSRPTKPCP
jgi:hypothetical protein